MARDFTKIQAWRLADDLVVQVYELTKSFPREETYGLTSQVRRAASSVPANIAEGANRASKKEYLHFLSIATGSLAETRYFLHLSKRLGYLNETTYHSSNNLAEETSKTLSGLVAAVQKEIAIQVTSVVLPLSALISTFYFVWKSVI
jgi:four helix bundle protein